MKTIGIRTAMNRNTLLAAFTLIAVILASGHLSGALAQGSQDQAIEQAQRAVKQRIISQEAGRDSRQGGRNLSTRLIGFTSYASLLWLSWPVVTACVSGKESGCTKRRALGNCENACICWS